MLVLSAGGMLFLAGLLELAQGRVVLPGGGTLALPCLLRYFTGLPCPLCGMTRSFVSVVHGELTAAFHYHPAGPALVIGCLAVALLGIRYWMAGRPVLVERRGFSIGLRGFAVGLVSIWLLRMLTGSLP